VCVTQSDAENTPRIIPKRAPWTELTPVSRVDASGFPSPRARVYLAFMRWLQGDADAAMVMAQSALKITKEIPSWRAYALAVSASVLLGQRKPSLALERAEEAVAIFENLEGVAEGESLSQVTYALALRAAGREAEGRRRIAAARRRLLEKADWISDPAWRQSFLDNVLDNARLLHVAAEWLGDDSPPPGRASR
jgi:eukaryotic-like serine/threonine-protein kinase